MTPPMRRLYCIYIYPQGLSFWDGIFHVIRAIFGVLMGDGGGRGQEVKAPKIIICFAIQGLAFSDTFRLFFSQIYTFLEVKKLYFLYTVIFQ